MQVKVRLQKSSQWQVSMDKFFKKMTDIMIYILICLSSTGFINALVSSRTIETVVYGAWLSILILILNLIQDEK